MRANRNDGSLPQASRRVLAVRTMRANRNCSYGAVADGGGRYVVYIGAIVGGLVALVRGLRQLRAS